MMRTRSPTLYSRPRGMCRCQSGRSTSAPIRSTKPWTTCPGRAVGTPATPITDMTGVRLSRSSQRSWPRLNPTNSILGMIAYCRRVLVFRCRDGLIHRLCVGRNAGMSRSPRIPCARHSCCGAVCPTYQSRPASIRPTAAELRVVLTSARSRAVTIALWTPGIRASQTFRQTSPRPAETVCSSQTGGPPG